MKSFIAAVFVAIAVAAGGAGILDTFQESAGSAFTTSGVRLDPGH